MSRLSEAPMRSEDMPTQKEFPTQVVLLSEHILWTESIQAALVEAIKPGANPESLNALVDVCTEQIQASPRVPAPIFPFHPHSCAWTLNRVWSDFASSMNHPRVLAAPAGLDPLLEHARVRLA